MTDASRAHMCSGVCSLVTRAYLCVWLCAVALSGCGAKGPEALRVAVEAEPGANSDAPVAVAVLVVYEDAVFRELSKLSATEWFAEAEQRKRDNPDRTDFDLLTWEVMPGQRIKETDFELQGRPEDGLVFADYLSEGRHRNRFNPEKRIIVVLGKNDFMVLDRRED